MSTSPLLTASALPTSEKNHTPGNDDTDPPLNNFEAGCGKCVLGATLFDAAFTAFGFTGLIHNALYPPDLCARGAVSSFGYGFRFLSGVIIIIDVINILRCSPLKKEYAASAVACAVAMLADQALIHLDQCPN